MNNYLLTLLGSSTDEFYELNHWPKEGEYAESKDNGRKVGGAPLNMSCVVASKGSSVKCLDLLSDSSDSSKFIVDALNSYGIDTSNVEYGKAVNCKVVILNSGDKRTMLITHPQRPFYKIDEKKQELLNNATYIYSMMHIINRSFENLDPLLKAKENGAKILLDASSEFTLDWERNILFTLADGIFINVDDYQHLVDNVDNDPKKMLFNRGCEFICVTDGSNGTVLYTKDEVIKAESCKTEVIDSTGAGDSFAGGFVYGLLQGYPLEKCLRIASVSGSYACTKHGGQGGCCTIEELYEYANKKGYKID